MKNTLNIADITITYNGFQFTENNIIDNGFKSLTSKDLLAKITNKKIQGDYPMGYTFITTIFDDGTTKGINNVGSKDFGKWQIDTINNTLILNWNYGWLNTITRAYEIDNQIVFFDIDTGNWRTTFKIITEI